MKSHYFILTLFAFCLNNSFSQYALSYSMETYTHLVNADTIDESQTFQFNSLDIYNPIPIGFSFNINGETFDSIAIAQRGFAMFRDVVPKYYMSVFECELKDFNDNPQNSPILYSTEGAVGNRIFKCEYKMMGFVNDPENDDFVSAQLWLYESCNTLEVRIGNYSVNSDVFLVSFPAPYIGFGDYNNNANNQILEGTTTNPVTVTTNSTLDTIPPINSVYTFVNCSAGIEGLNNELSFYPNPSRDKLFVTISNGIIEETELNVFDLFGRKISSFVLEGKSEEQVVDLSDLSSGTYIFTYQIAGSLYSQRIIKE